MKNLIKNYPTSCRFAFAIILFGLSLILSGMINKGSIKTYFPFTSTICLTFTTWIMLKTDNKSLNDIGFDLKLKNIAFLPLGILIGAIAFLIAKYLRAIYLGESIEMNESINFKNILYGLYILLPTVAAEEFLFRGYLFTKTIEKSSVLWANILFGILFTLVHVFDSTVINNPAKILFFSITIPIGHLLFATAMLKSKSLYFPIGIHLGNNWATMHLISSQTSSDSIFLISNSVYFNTWPSFILFILLWNGFYLILIYIIWKWNSITCLF